MAKPVLIFDFDNTLVDTRGVGVIALREVAAFLRTKFPDYFEGDDDDDDDKDKADDKDDKDKAADNDDKADNEDDKDEKFDDEDDKADDNDDKDDDNDDKDDDKDDDNDDKAGDKAEDKAEDCRRRTRLLFEAFEKNLKERGEDKSGKVDIETWRAGLWRQAALAAGVGDRVTESVAAELNACWRETRLRHLEIEDSVRTMLQRLREDFTLCLLTNGNSKVQSEKIQRTGAAILFDLVVISGDHPWEKPAKEIYDWIRDRLDREVMTDAVMIGDNWDTDIRGGVNAGVKALVWIRRAKEEEEEEEEEEEDRRKMRILGIEDRCFRTTSVLDLPDILRRIYDS